MANWLKENDEALLAAIKEGSHAAFALLVERHSSRFYAVAYRFVHQRESAEDIVQEAFLKLWQSPDIWQSEKGAKFTTWFYRIVTNLCLDMRKRKSPLSIEDDMEFADTRALQDEALVQAREQAQLEKAIAALPERQRTALNLCFTQGVSNQEAADIMHINLKALQSLVMRAKTTLKETLKEKTPWLQKKTG